MTIRNLSHSSVCQFSGATRRKWTEVQLRMLSQRRAALGLPVRDLQESDPTRQQPSNPTDYFDDILRVLYNESVYVCFTSNPLRGVYHEILRLVYDETVPCALRGICFVINLTSHLRRNVGYDGRFTTKRVSRLIRRNTPFTTKLQRILPS
ncbi:hypothetical protein YC2023_089696 [Brassica napus]